MAEFVMPVLVPYVVTQTFDEHIQRAKDNGWCWKPGNCPGGVYYYGGVDLAPSMQSDWNSDVRLINPYRESIVITYAGWYNSKTGPGGGYGLYVKANAGKYVIILAHMYKLYVSANQAVPAGTVLGLMGSSGNSSGKHVHWEVRLNGIPVDPMKLVGDTSTPIPEEPTAPPPTALYEFEDLPPVFKPAMAAVIATRGLAVRNKPGKSIGKVNGYYSNGRIFSAYAQTILENGERWLMTDDGWVAYYADGGGPYVKRLV